MKEIWKDVLDWEKHYKISNFGRVLSKRRKVSTCDRNGENYTTRQVGGQLIKGAIDAAGYFRVDLRDTSEGRRKNTLVHRLVADAFVENIGNKPCVNHIDGIKTNNIFSNLEWCTHKENMKHAFKLGLATKFTGTEKGELCPSSKLLDCEVMEIKNRILKGESVLSISNDYPVSASAISEIKAGRSWAHISAGIKQ
jgi:hypothetical protein